MNDGVKEGGVMSILFDAYTDGLLKRLEDAGVGCHTGSCFYSGDCLRLLCWPRENLHYW